MNGIVKFGIIVGVLCASAASTRMAHAVLIPNANFDTLYKPGSTTITAALVGGYTLGIGSNVGLGAGSASYSDSTTGSTVDVPGWTGAGATGIQPFTPAAGQFPAGTDTQPNAVYVQGPVFGGTSNLFVTSGNLGALTSSTSYLLSIQVGWRNDVTTPASPVVLNLNSNAVAITPDVSVSPPLVQGSFVTYSRAYSAANLTALVGQPLTISFGVGPSAAGQQIAFDSVSLVDTVVPEPASVVLFGLGLAGLCFARRRNS